MFFFSFNKVHNYWHIIYLCCRLYISLACQKPLGRNSFLKLVLLFAFVLEIRNLFHRIIALWQDIIDYFTMVKCSTLSFMIWINRILSTYSLYCSQFSTILPRLPYLMNPTLVIFICHFPFNFRGLIPD